MGGGGGPADPRETSCQAGYRPPPRRPAIPTATHAIPLGMTSSAVEHGKAAATPRILDGIAIAGEIKAEVALEVQALSEQGIRPGLAVILVGEVPASQIYVRSKVKTCGELGIYSEMLTPPETITTEEMLALVADLNAREDKI